MSEEEIELPGFAIHWKPADEQSSHLHSVQTIQLSLLIVNRQSYNFTYI